MSHECTNCGQCAKQNQTPTHGDHCDCSHCRIVRRNRERRYGSDSPNSNHPAGWKYNQREWWE